jgi:hypothetical protein
MQDLAPYAIPLGAFAVAIVFIVSGTLGHAHARRVKADQRIALLQRGVPLDRIEAILKPADEPGEHETPSIRSPFRSLGNARRAATVLISTGIGLIVFFAALSVIVAERYVLAGAAVGLIPLAIGIGFLVDYSMQKRELARFGMEIGRDA